MRTDLEYTVLNVFDIKVVISYEIQSKCTCDLDDKFSYKKSRIHYSNVASFSKY